MKLYNITLGMLATFIGLAASGCSDSDDWTPGPQDNETGVSAYFPVPEKTSYIFDSELSSENMTINVSVSRKNTADAVSVPIILQTETEGISIPQSVNFGAGESTSSFLVNCAGIPDGKNVGFTISLDPSQTNTYGEGLYAVSFSVIKADWIEASDNVRYIYSDASGNQLYPDTYGKLYQLQGTDTFRLTDYFGSGLEMQFECTTPETTIMKPLINADFENVYEEDKENLGWYLYNEAEQDWPSWVPGNVEGYTAISYLTFFAVSNYNTCNLIYNPDTLYGYMWFSTGIDFADESFTWGSFQIDFNLKYNPFE